MLATTRHGHPPATVARPPLRRFRSEQAYIDDIPPIQRRAMRPRQLRDAAISPRWNSPRMSASSRSAASALSLSPLRRRPAVRGWKACPSLDAMAARAIRAATSGRSHATSSGFAPALRIRAPASAAERDPCQRPWSARREGAIKAAICAPSRHLHRVISQLAALLRARLLRPLGPMRLPWSANPAASNRQTARTRTHRHAGTSPGRP